MTKVALISDSDTEDSPPYRAVAGPLQSMGRTAGEAVDALAEQLSGEQSETLIIVRSLRADRFFTAGQRRRLDELMTQWRVARDAGEELTPENREELERLVESEVQATAERAGAISDDLSR